MEELTGEFTVRKIILIKKCPVNLLFLLLLIRNVYEIKYNILQNNVRIFIFIEKAVFNKLINIYFY